MKCSGASPGVAVAVHAKEVRGIDHRRHYVAILRHLRNVLPGVRKIDGPLPGHDAKDIQRKQHARRLQFRLRLLQEAGDDIAAMPLRMLGLKAELRVLLVAFRRKAHVVELNLVGPVFGRKLCQANVVVPNLGVGGVGPDQLAVFPPCSPVAARLHRQLRMPGHQHLVAEDRDARDGVQALPMEIGDELRQIADGIALLLRRQRQSGRHAHRAIGVLNIEDHAVAAGLAPGADDLQPLGAAGHRARQVNRPDLEVPRDRHRFLRPILLVVGDHDLRYPAWARFL